jgi:hypothetical protein
MLTSSSLNRYVLLRNLNNGYQKEVCYVLLNPSTGNDYLNDNTVNRCIRIAKHNQFGRIIIVNLFSRRTPYPRILRSILRAEAGSPSPLDDAVISRMARRADAIVAAWGNPQNSLIRKRADAVLNLLKLAGLEILCLGTTTFENPKHPCLLSYKTSMVHI